MSNLKSKGLQRALSLLESDQKLGAQAFALGKARQHPTRWKLSHRITNWYVGYDDAAEAMGPEVEEPLAKDARAVAHGHVVHSVVGKSQANPILTAQAKFMELERRVKFLEQAVRSIRQLVRFQSNLEELKKLFYMAFEEN